MDLTFVSEQGKLNIRVAAVIMQKGKILLEKDETHGFYAFPGGRVKFGETADKAIERELTEEIGEKPCIIRPLYVAQGLFELDGCKYHELCFYFLADVSQNLFDKGSFKNNDGENKFYWMDICDISSYNVVPKYIKEHLKKLPDNLELILTD